VVPFGSHLPAPQRACRLVWCADDTNRQVTFSFDIAEVPGHTIRGIMRLLRSSFSVILIFPIRQGELAMPRLGLLGMMLSLQIAVLAAADERVWTDTQGRTMRAEFVREVAGDVTFLKDGKLVTMPLERLSESDRQIVRDLVVGKTVGADVASDSGRPLTAQAPTAGTSAAPPSSVEPSPFDGPAKPALAPPASGESPARSLAKKAIPLVNRVWTDVSGNQTTAKFVRVTGGNVVLSLRSGRAVSVRFYDLTVADQDYVKELLTSRGDESQIPPPPPATLPADAAPSAPAAEPDRAPASGSPPLSPPPGVPQRPPIGGASAMMEEMRQRAEQQRQEMHQRLEQHRQEMSKRMEESHQQLAEMRGQTRLGQEPDQGAVGSATTGGTNSAESNDKAPSTTLDPKTIADARRILVISFVVAGVIGIVAVVVFVATTIAAGSSVSRQRRYS
jgi:hypothetical protein